MMNNELLDKIGRLAEQLDNCLFSYKNMKTLPDRIHLQGLSGTMESVRNDLGEIYKENGGTEELKTLPLERREILWSDYGS